MEWRQADAQQLPFPDAGFDALARLFPDDPPHFLPRMPYGYHDVELIRSELASAGFSGAVMHEVVAASSRAESAYMTATALCQGSPLGDDIEARAPARLQEATEAAAAALAEKFGGGPSEGRMQAIVFTCEA